MKGKTTGRTGPTAQDSQQKGTGHRPKQEETNRTDREPRILIAIPCMDTVPVLFMTSLINLRKTGNTSYAPHANSLIYDSRNNFAANAIQKGYDRVLWLDSDMVFEPDMLERLNRTMDEGNLDYVSALCFKRRMPTRPVVYKDLIYEIQPDNTVRASAVPMLDYPQDSVFEIAGSGFGAVLVKTELLEAVWKHYGPPFQPMIQMGEDLAFCWRVNQLGRKMWCDSRVKVGHCGQMVFDERMFLAQQMADGRQNQQDAEGNDRPERQNAEGNGRTNIPYDDGATEEAATCR